MEIVLNNKNERLDTAKISVTIDELLVLKNFTFELLIVRINGELVKKSDYSSAAVKPGDKVDVIHVFGGG